jgi:hypothetical protein
LTIKVDIQIFNRSALPTEMDIQTSDNINVSPVPRPSATSEKRVADQAPDDEPPAKKREKKRYKMNPTRIKQGVEALVKRYQLDEAQKGNLESIAEFTHFVPSVELVEWVATEARLREHCSHEFEIYMFAYVEFFPWFSGARKGILEAVAR